MNEYNKHDEEKQEVQLSVLPVEQQILVFYGKPLIVVRLPDGRPAVALSSFCNNLQIDAYAQVKRIRRTEAIADDLIDGVRVDRPIEEGGPQVMSVLVLRAVPFWLAGIDHKRVREEIKSDILRYQREVVDVLYSWAQQSSPALVASADLMPSEPVAKPVRPAQDAPLLEWKDYYLRMAAFLDWQVDMEQWRGKVETRIDGVETRQDGLEVRMEGYEALAGLIPEILQSLPEKTITVEHQRQVQTYVRQLCSLTNKAPGTVYDNLKNAFQIPRYTELLEADWEKVARWFEAQIQRAKKR